MSTRYRVLPYRQGSKSAKALAEALGGRVLKLIDSQFKPREGDVIINWGNTNPPDNLATSHGDFMYPGFINDPNDIRNASNKLNFFGLMYGSGLEHIVPRYWTDKETIPDDAFPIVCRTVLSGHSGDGIVIANSRGDLVPAPLYVEYKKKKDEYRIHVGMTHTYQDGQPFQNMAEIIAVQRKAKRHDATEVNWQIRNHSNGFVYVRQDVNPPSAVVEAAKKALEATGLDFGAVDVIWNANEERAYVLEVNTAPGLEGQTVTDYQSFFEATSI